MLQPRHHYCFPPPSYHVVPTPHQVQQPPLGSVSERFHIYSKTIFRNFVTHSASMRETREVPTVALAKN